MRTPSCLVSAVAAAALAGALLAPAGHATRGPPGAAGSVATSTQTSASIAPIVRTYAVRGVDQRGLSALGRAAANRVHRYAALSAPEPATGFAVTGVTWSGQAPRGLALALRTRTGDAWSRWAPMVYEADHGPSQGSAEARHAVPGTDPFVVGEVDDVQLKVVSDDRQPPNGLTLTVIDPGQSSRAPAPSYTAVSAAEITDPVVTPSATPMPDIYSRADWGADESLRGCCVEYGEVHAGFVHHTVNSNDYTRADVPAILRGIYAYHTQSRGWRDIGYNFLIDKFGRIWEGRYGGITMPVIGAHTLDYNENSFGASAIGNYETAQPSRAMLDAFARLFAWKLSLHGVRPASRQKVGGTTFNAISGHRDAAQTLCPGINLYLKIPKIIAKAASYQHPFRGRGLPHSFAQDAAPDILMVDRASGQVLIARGTGGPGFDTRRVATADFAGHDEVVGVGDVTGDGLNDVMARTIGTGVTEVFRGLGDGTFAPPERAGRKWAGTDLFAGPGDLDGDGTNDVVARDLSSGSLLFYPGRPSGGFGAGTVALESFGAFDSLAAAGDFDGDGNTDVLTRTSGGALRVLLGNGAGQFPSTLRLHGDWSGKDVITGGSDLTGDARPDVVARGRDSLKTAIFANIGGTRLSPAFADLQTHATMMDLSPDLTGDHRPDLVMVTPAGSLVIVPARRQNWVSPAHLRGAIWPGMSRVLVVGDWNGDGYVDAMARERGTGKLWLFPGRGSGGFGAPTGGWAGWAMRADITPVGDFDGDGRPDLMARAADGHIYLYPGRGDKGVKPPVLMRSSIPDGSSMVGIGLWNSDGAPDVAVRTTTGQLLLYPGNGAGGLEEPISVGRGFDRYDALVGVGDLNGDGQPDLIGRTPDGDGWLIPGVAPSADKPSGGFSLRQYLASGWSAYRLG